MNESADIIESGAVSPAAVERSPAEIEAAMAVEADHAAEAAAIRETEEAPDADADALAFLVENDFFGVEPHAPEAMVQVIETMVAEYHINFCDPEALTEMGLTEDFVTGTIAPDFVSRCEGIENDETVEGNVEVMVDANDTSELLATEARTEVERLRTIPDLTLTQIQEIINAPYWEHLASEPDFLAERTKLQGIATDLNNVAAIAPADNPEEAAVLQQIVASTPVSWQEPSPSVRYAAIITQINAGQLSDDTRRRAIEALGIEYSAAPEITTGSDVNDALEAGRGTEQVQVGTETVEDPPGSGNFVDQPIYESRPIPYTEEDPLRPRPNMEVYEDEDGSRTVRINVDGRMIETHVGEDIEGDDLGRVANTMAVMQVAESMGLNNVFFQKGLNQLGGGAPITIDWDDMVDAELVAQSFLGGLAGQDGEILTEHDTERLRHNFQWLRRGEASGDGGAEDHDTSRAMEDLRTLGILDATGALNQVKLRAAGHYIQQNAGTGTSEFEALEAYLSDI